MTTEQETRPETMDNKKLALEIFILLCLCIVVFIFAGQYDVMERLMEFSKRHENLELDELFTLSVFFAIAAVIFSARRWLQAREAQELLARRNQELQRALSEIKYLRGILPICAKCKKIRDDKGSWHQVEVYVRDHTDAEFSHSICPDCMKQLYPEMFGENAAAGDGTDQFSDE